MNYSHKFLDAFFLEKRSESRISENPDHRFTTWTTITDLTAEDLEGRVVVGLSGRIEVLDSLPLVRNTIPCPTNSLA